MYANEVEELSSKFKEQQEELTKMKREVERAKAEVSDAKCTLSDVMRQLHIAQKQHDTASTKVRKYQEKLEDTIGDFIHFEDEILEKNDELTRLVSDLKAEIVALSSSNVALLGSGTEESVSFCFQTKDGGKVYTHAIRELYYSIPTNHPAFTGIIPQNNRVSRHPGLMQENPDFLFSSSRSSLAGTRRAGAQYVLGTRCVLDAYRSKCNVQLTMAASSS